MTDPSDNKGTNRSAIIGVIVLLMLAAAVVVYWRARDTRPTFEDGKRPPNIVLVTIESLRTDHVGCYSSPVPTSPVLDEFAKESVLYENAYAVTSWTLASHASLFTGLYPAAHQTTEPLSTLGDSYTTIAEVLYDRGYQCGGVVSGPYLTTRHNLNQGFDWYDESPSDTVSQVAHGDVTNEQMTEAIETFLSKDRDADRPFFLFAYYWDPHYDYIPPAPYDTQFMSDSDVTIDVTDYERANHVNPDISINELNYVKSQYNGEIRWTDDHLAKLFDAIRKTGEWDNTVVIITADHGEEFFDHGHKGHKNNIYDESVHVPLIIKFDAHRGVPAGRDARLVSHVDIFPTLMHIAGASLPSDVQGYSIIGAPVPDRAVYLDLLAIWYGTRPGETERIEQRRQWYGVRRGHQKLVTIDGISQFQLFDLAIDPRETRDYASDPARATTAKEFQALIDAYKQQGKQFASQFVAGDKAKLSDRDLERMKALGYIE